MIGFLLIIAFVYTPSVMVCDSKFLKQRFSANHIQDPLARDSKQKSACLCVTNATSKMSRVDTGIGVDYLLYMDST